MPTLSVFDLDRRQPPLPLRTDRVHVLCLQRLILVTTPTLPRTLQGRKPSTLQGDYHMIEQPLKGLNHPCKCLVLVLCAFLLVLRNDFLFKSPLCLRFPSLVVQLDSVIDRKYLMYSYIYIRHIYIGARGEPNPCSLTRTMHRQLASARQPLT